MEVAQGHVTDRPFARTVYTVAAKHFTGDLVLEESGRSYKLSWEDGQVVAAESPSPADSPPRVALASGLVSSTHVSRALELMAKEPGREAIQVLQELARLSPDQMIRLKRKLLVQRASRVFALPNARFVLDNARSLRADADVPALDARWLIYFGVRTHYTIDRLDGDLAAVMERPLTLARDAAAGLPAFGFADSERHVLDRLRQRAWTLHQLSEASPELEARIVRSIVYSLIACDCLEEGAPATAAPPRPTSTTAAPPRPAPPPATTPPPLRRRPSTAAQRTRTITRPGIAPPGTQLNAPRKALLAQGTARHIDFTEVAAPGSAAGETLELIARKLAELDAGANHFSMLGVPSNATVDEIRAAYFSLAKRLHPDRLQAVGVTGSAADAQRLFARINLAFGVLTDPVKRAEYNRMLVSGGEEAVTQAQMDADEMATRILRAEETFHRGEMALRRNQFVAAQDLFEEAVALNPEEAEYLALLAWATWLAADDKIQVAAAVQKRLSDAVRLSPRCVPAHFYRGQVAKHIGRTAAAIEAFKQVIDLQPDHGDANLELRVLLGRERRDDSKRFLDKLKKPPR
jgi:tetratricopeptide (TPR) repeat protein